MTINRQKIAKKKGKKTFGTVLFFISNDVTGKKLVNGSVRTCKI